MRRYRYVGPADLRGLPHAVDSVDVDTAEAFRTWLAGQDPQDRTAPFTYVITVREVMRVAPRRREHVACAQGEDVLGAGEIQFELDEAGLIVTEISNQSTGYCPDLDSWHAVSAALRRAELHHPVGFTQPIVFRGCTTCFAINIVRDHDFACAVCGDTVPSEWNLDQF